MEQARKRSLTKSEKAAEQILIALRTLRFIPARSYDSVIWDPIKRVTFEKDKNGYVNEIRGRNVAFEWELESSVTLVLRQGRYYFLADKKEYKLLLREDRMGSQWRVESIEIESKRNVVSLEEHRQTDMVGKIVFDNQAAVSMIKMQYV